MSILKISRQYLQLARNINKQPEDEQITITSLLKYPSLRKSQRLWFVRVLYEKCSLEILYTFVKIVLSIAGEVILIPPNTIFASKPGKCLLLILLSLKP